MSARLIQILHLIVFGEERLYLHTVTMTEFCRSCIWDLLRLLEAALYLALRVNILSLYNEAYYMKSCDETAFRTNLFSKNLIIVIRSLMRSINVCLFTCYSHVDGTYLLAFMQTTNANFCFYIGFN